MRSIKLKKLLVGSGVIVALAFIAPGIAEARDNKPLEGQYKRISSLWLVEELCDSLGGTIGVLEDYPGGWRTYECYDENDRMVMFCSEHDGPRGEKYWECHYVNTVPVPPTPTTATNRPNEPIHEPGTPAPPYHQDFSSGYSLQVAKSDR